MINPSSSEILEYRNLTYSLLGQFDNGKLSEQREKQIESRLAELDNKYPRICVQAAYGTRAI